MGRLGAVVGRAGCLLVGLSVFVGLSSPVDSAALSCPLNAGPTPVLAVGPEVGAWAPGLVFGPLVFGESPTVRARLERKDGANWVEVELRAQWHPLLTQHPGDTVAIDLGYVLLTPRDRGEWVSDSGLGSSTCRRSTFALSTSPNQQVSSRFPKAK